MADPRSHFYYTARLTLWRNLMAYFVLSRNGKNPLINPSRVQIRNAIRIILEEDRTTGVILLV